MEGEEKMEKRRRRKDEREWMRMRGGRKGGEGRRREREGGRKEKEEGRKKEGVYKELSIFFYSIFILFF